MNLKVKFENTLPKINTAPNFFIILKSQKNNLGKLWYQYLEKVILISMTTEYFKVIKDAFKNSVQLHELKRDYARNLLGIGEELSVIDIKYNNGCTDFIPKMNFVDLVNIYADINAKTYKRMVIDRFFIFLYNKGILLYPIIHKLKNYHRPSDWNIFVEDSEIISFLNKWYSTKEISDIKTFQMNAIISVISSTTWKKIDDITNEDISALENVFKDIQNEIQKRLSYTSSILTELRLALINKGRLDIEKPKDITNKRKNYSKKRRFEFLDTDTYPNLKYLKEKALGYYDILEKEGLATGTITGELTALSNFFDYIMEYYPDSIIDISTIEDMFDPSNPINLYDILSDKMKSSKQTLNKIVKFLVHCDLFSMKAKKNIPIRKNRSASRAPYRNAMPKNMIIHILDIIKNRPPLLKTKWDRNKTDISWWKFEVYPIYPLMMLFQYYIPVRGEQVRNICRKKSFIIDENRIKTIIINTDKNVNRKNYQEIPCVWDDLQIFVKLIKWHKEYFKNIPLVKYHNDINSPWEDIEPLFNTPQHLEPVSSKTHFNYHKKILCQYQLEVIEQAKKERKDTYPVVAWAKKGKRFFESVIELNRCSQDRLNDIEVMYDLHSLRVTGATRYLESGLGINLVMQLTGHVRPDTLMRVYINLTLDEKREKLKSAIKNIYFGEPKELLKNTADLISGEMISAYEKNSQSLQKALSDNKLFSVTRMLPEGSNHTEYILGTDIAKKNHPSTWSPMVHGICPATKCPVGRENKCSLCPYLITGKLFIHGIVLKANQALAKFQRDAIQKQEEEQKDYKNSALAQSLELQLEEILGWWEIMEKINKNTFISEKKENSKSIIKDNKQKDSVFAYETYKTELTYLANAYEADLIGVEQDRVGLKILTIKAMKIALNNKDNNTMYLLANNEKYSIDYLMKYYKNKQIENNKFKNFINAIK